ncbi:MAG: undecaprenyl/decaprenyl-phosphate alpha-N-acetylglucosaminyl 1-phosphate transferase [Armatimonadetes bacterium]|jgi:UDP-GlcNAc:undecaprenyl-phosphate GlcNAc-1-phosphate transferase|nr:undecaprenyl/decaprenyl-phosphate alpha-N-acetylglucosaminyl 1-phosphate transferase [Armatimonadota bacterium]
MTSFFHCLVAFILAAFGAYLLTPVVEQLARTAGVVRLPRARDVHVGAMPLWGGLAIVVATLMAILLTVPLTGQHQRSLAGIVIGSLIITMFGVLDDKYDLHALIQLLILMGVGWLITVFGIKMSFISNPFGPGTIDLDLLHLSVPVTIIWVVCVTKATDIIDGVDGLAAGISAISAGTLALMAIQQTAQRNVIAALMAAALAGSCVGFLRHNFNPARIFMGTVGAQFLGFMLACLTMISLTKVATVTTVFISVMVLGVPVIDAAFVTLKRLVTMQPLHKADKGHVHHRLLKRGLTQRQTVYVLYAVSLVFCAAAVLMYTFQRH